MIWLRHCFPVLQRKQQREENCKPFFPQNPSPSARRYEMRFSPPASRRKRSSEHWDFSLAAENSLDVELQASSVLLNLLRSRNVPEAAKLVWGSWRVNPKRQGRVSLKSLDGGVDVAIAREGHCSSKGARGGFPFALSRSARLNSPQGFATHFSPIQDSSPTALYR